MMCFLGSDGMGGHLKGWPAKNLHPTWYEGQGSLFHPRDVGSPFWSDSLFTVLSFALLLFGSCTYYSLKITLGKCT